MKLTSSLTEMPRFFLSVGFLNIVMLVLVVHSASSTMAVPSGIDVQAPVSRFLRMQQDRAIVISVSAGDEPAYIINNQKFTKLDAISKRLDELAKEDELSNETRRIVVLQIDRAATRGTEQALVDLVLFKGFRCSIATIPN